MPMRLIIYYWVNVYHNNLSFNANVGKYFTKLISMDYANT